MGAVRAELVGERDRFLRRVVGQAEHDEIDRRHHVALAGGRVLALVGVDALARAISGTAASRSRMPRPVVPASPSMKIDFRFWLIRTPDGCESEDFVGFRHKKTALWARFADGRAQAERHRGRAGAAVDGATSGSRHVIMTLDMMEGGPAVNSRCRTLRSRGAERGEPLSIRGDRRCSGQSPSMTARDDQGLESLARMRLASQFRPLAP